MPPVTTIAEIARQAGVGTATVDRVLNGRPGVNADTVQKVMQAVAELGTPQLPGRPRSRENLRFAYVLPADDSAFLDLVERQIAQAAGDFRHQHITEITHRFDTSDPTQFAAQLAQIGDCAGIALLAPDLPPVKLAINELVRAGVHVVTLFSDVAGSMRETHIGADNRAAGRTAGLLLARMAGPTGAQDTLLLSSQATRLTAEIDRRIGFAQVIEERFPGLRMIRLPDLPADDDGVAEALAGYLKDLDEPHRVAGLYNVGSGSAGAARAIEAQALGALASGVHSVGRSPPQAGQRRRIALVAHDFTEVHRDLLAADRLAYVLHQDIHYCVLTAARVLRALCENVRGALNVVQPRFEILTAENMH